VVFPNKFGPLTPTERRASEPHTSCTKYDLDQEQGTGDRSEGTVPGGNVRSEVGFLVVPHGRGAETDGHEARSHRDLVAPETRRLRLWLGRWLKSEDAEGEACNSKGV